MDIDGGIDLTYTSTTSGQTITNSLGSSSESSWTSSISSGIAGNTMSLEPYIIYSTATGTTNSTSITSKISSCSFVSGYATTQSYGLTQALTNHQ
jgi:hypothetical protein